jgi:crotonobetainyl-CoA:carnitine CoA-transferase CaiB-like acyl-CoA transferase
MGSAHPNVVPYQAFPSSDGYFILGAGNDEQFQRLCKLLGQSDWCGDPRFATNAARVRHRDTLVDLIAQHTSKRASEYWLAQLEQIGLPCAPVNTIDQVFADPQVRHRGMKISMAHTLAASGAVDLIGNPLKLSVTPAAYDRAPPQLGEHTQEVFTQLLNLSATDFQQLREQGVI